MKENIYKSTVLTIWPIHVKQQVHDFSDTQNRYKGLDYIFQDLFRQSWSCLEKRVLDDLLKLPLFLLTSRANDIKDPMVSTDFKEQS